MDIAITIEGITPLLVNRFTDVAAANATSGVRGIGPNGDSPAEDAESRLHTNEEGLIIMPSPNLGGSFRGAGRFHKIGKSKVSTLTSSLVPCSVNFDAIYYPIEHEKPWRVDTRPVCIPSTKGRINRHRPCFEDWKITFGVTLDTETIPPKLFRAIVDDAGKKVGLCDYRPSRNGPFGRFVVTNWEITE